MVSGATGQLQVAGEDILHIWIPESVIAKAKNLSTSYAMVIRQFESLTSRIRRRICAVSAGISELILDADSLSEAGQGVLRNATQPEELYRKLQLLKPNMF